MNTKPNYLWKQRIATGLAILIFSAISVTGIHQYQYITAEKLAFIKASINNSIYPDDYLLKETYCYYTYFYKILGGMVKYFHMDIPILLFMVYFIAVLMTFLGVWRIASLLFGKTEVGLLALFFLLFGNKAALASVPALGTVLTERVLALPVLIFSFYYYFREKYVLSFVLQGIAFLIHPLSTAYVFAMLFVTSVLRLKYIGIRKFAVCITAFAVLISPILIWKILYPPPSLSMFHADSRWIELLRLRSSHHIFPFSWDVNAFLRESLILLLFFISWKYPPPNLHHHRTLQYSVMTLFVLWGIGTIFTEIFPMPVVIQLQFFRSSSFLVYFAVIYFSNYLMTAIYKEKNLWNKLTVIFISTGLFIGPHWWIYAYGGFFVLAALPVLFHTVYQEPMPVKSVGSAVIAVTLILGIGYLIRTDFDFSIYNNQEKNWVAVQKWAKAHTDSQDIFIVPPSISGFRDESERTIYGDWKDGTQMFFNPAFGYEWIRRMKALGYREEMQIKGFENLTELEKGFKSLTESDFLQIADEPQMNRGQVFLVTFREKDALAFPKRYNNERFIVYKIVPNL
jgi:hypothetical protein